MELLAHLLVPLLLVLVIYPEIPKKHVLILLPLTVVPDLDFFMQHSILLHNVFAALLVAVNNLILENSLISLFLALIIVFIVLIAIFRSLRFAALTMIPVLMVVAYMPFTLVSTGIDLNLVTAMIGSIIVGVGIDFGIHMTERVREAGEDFAGIRKSVETSGFTFLEATVTIVAGLLSVMLINIRSESLQG